MASTHSDQNILAGDPNFQGRVRAALISACISISNEGWAVAFHRERSTFASQILNAPDTYKFLFANTVATDTAVISDATAVGTVVLTAGNVQVQAALVTDAHIDNAISSEFNSFIRVPGS